MNIETEYIYWEIRYISCEGNKRWTLARTLPHFNEYDVRERIPMSGMGDDPAQIIEVFEVIPVDENDISWDFT